LLVLTAFISSSLELALPSTLVHDRLGVSSRRIPSREARPPQWGEVTLSQELRTAGLLRPHVLVGYRWSHIGLCPGGNPVITGSSAASCHSPLRTARATFTAHGSPVPGSLRRFGSRHFGYLVPYCSGPPVSLRLVAGFPDLGLLSRLRRHGARAREAILSSCPRRRPSMVEAPHLSPSVLSLSTVRRAEAFGGNEPILVISATPRWTW
jgi:hypothetical protein